MSSGEHLSLCRPERKRMGKRAKVYSLFHHSHGKLFQLFTRTNESPNNENIINGKRQANKLNKTNTK
jgi:hypothetical protein